MREIIKTTLKLLVRNKGFWFFLIISPLLSTLCLKNKKENLAYYAEAEKAQIEELENVDDKVAYFAEKDNGKYIIKIYDASGSELSEYLLNKLFHLQIDLFQVKYLLLHIIHYFFQTYFVL